MSAIHAVDLGKAYRTYRRPIDSLKELVLRRSYAQTFWAIRGVHLDVPRGGSLGIVGNNGAGKTTLLKLLSGATAPTEGLLERQGRSSAILSLGAGFHADLTGRENIGIGCAVLGLSPGETAEVAPAILEFSELGAFIDQPLRTYSSGMYLRLAFSVATAIDPEVLIVDEHLAVGDQHFRHKCLRRIMALRQAGCSLVLCSHDFYSIREVCDRTMWVRDGRVSMVGPTDDVLSAYQDHVRSMESGATELRATPSATTPDASAPKENRIINVQLCGGGADHAFSTGDALELRIEVDLTEAALTEGVYAGLVLLRNDGVWCYGLKSSDSRPPGELTPLGGGRHGIVFAIPRLPLLAGQYAFTVALMDNRSPHAYDCWTHTAAFSVTTTGEDVGMVRLDHEWRPFRSA